MPESFCVRVLVASTGHSIRIRFRIRIHIRIHIRTRILSRIRNRTCTRTHILHRIRIRLGFELYDFWHFCISFVPSEGLM